MTSFSTLNSASLDALEAEATWSVNAAMEDGREDVARELATAYSAQIDRLRRDLGELPSTLAS